MTNDTTIQTQTLDGRNVPAIYAFELAPAHMNTDGIWAELETAPAPARRRMLRAELALRASNDERRTRKAHNRTLAAVSAARRAMTAAPTDAAYDAACLAWDKARAAAQAAAVVYNLASRRRQDLSANT